eukprot:TRINITY_DN2584_c0_g1_i1.p1 TRINITY_DN2584_c0_g1~~TRINITY_DN2584_c0_g1_i1.p1  ORF type:complete len:751 (-),score=65.04 TRINITY_DN2584_c0_g1_i1:2615-4867(-)
MDLARQLNDTKHTSCLRKVLTRILWFDQTYPIGEIAGYIEGLKGLLWGTHYTIANCEEQLREILMINKMHEYTVIVSGKSTDEIVAELNKASNVVSIIVIDNEQSKDYSSNIKFVKSVKELFSLLTQNMETISEEFKMSPILSKPIFYDLRPDPFTMSNTAMLAYKNEGKKTAEISKSQKMFALALRMVLKEPCYESEIHETYLEHYERENWRNSKSHKIFRHVMKIALHFNQSPVIVSGLPFEFICELMKSNPDNTIFDYHPSRKLFKDAYYGFVKERLLEKSKQEVILKELHKHLILVITYLVKENYEEAFYKFANSSMCQMLLHDIDFCLEVYLYFIYAVAAKIPDTDKERWKWIILDSDPRVKHFIEFLQDWNFAEEPKDTFIPKQTVTTLLIGTMELVEYEAIVYTLVADLLKDEDIWGKISHSLVYFVVDLSFTSADMRKVLSKCTDYAVTPIFVLLLKEKQPVLSKELFRLPVQIVYCQNEERVAKYIKEQERNWSKVWSVIDKGDTVSRRWMYELPNENTTWTHLTLDQEKKLNEFISKPANNFKTPVWMQNYALLCAKEIVGGQQFWEKHLEALGVVTKRIPVSDLVFCKKLISLLANFGEKEEVEKVFNNCGLDHIKSLCNTIRSFAHSGGLKSYNGSVYYMDDIGGIDVKDLEIGSKICLTKFVTASKKEPEMKETYRTVFEIQLTPSKTPAIELLQEGISSSNKDAILLLPYAIFYLEEIRADQKILALRQIQQQCLQ